MDDELYKVLTDAYSALAYIHHRESSRLTQVSRDRLAEVIGPLDTALSTEEHRRQQLSRSEVKTDGDVSLDFKARILSYAVLFELGQVADIKVDGTLAYLAYCFHEHIDMRTVGIDEQLTAANEVINSNRDLILKLKELEYGYCLALVKQQLVGRDWRDWYGVVDHG